VYCKFTSESAGEKFLKMAKLQARVSIVVAFFDSQSSIILIYHVKSCIIILLNRTSFNTDAAVMELSYQDGSR